MTGVDRIKEAARFAAFFSEVDSLPRTGDKGCKLWVRNGHQPEDYPTLTAGNHRYRGSRLVLARKLGRAIRPGFYACHSCDVPGCVNEEHIYEGTPQQNSADMVRRNRCSHANPRETVAPSEPLKSTRWVQRPPARVSPQGNALKSRRPGYKLSEEDAQTIRETYFRGGVSLRALGARYGVAPGTIGRVVRN